MTTLNTMKKTQAKLYLVITPIGNLGDIAYRSIEVLNDVDIIACEDTRNSKKLLDKYEIKKKLISYHNFNEESSSEEILSFLMEGKDVALISDAGYPLISDPGYSLVIKAIDNNIDISIFRYAGNSFEITIKLSAEELNPTEEYSGIIVFDFDLDNYLDK